jgi:hypothetical protein
MLDLRAPLKRINTMSYASPWESAPKPLLEHQTTPSPTPAELESLRQRLSTLSPRLRAELEPLVDDAFEQAQFRARVLTLARDALAHMRLELELTKFDLDMTRRERDELRSACV